MHASADCCSTSFSLTDPPPPPTHSKTYSLSQLLFSYVLVFPTDPIMFWFMIHYCDVILFFKVYRHGCSWTPQHSFVRCVIQLLATLFKLTGEFDPFSYLSWFFPLHLVSLPLFFRDMEICWLFFMLSWLSVGHFGISFNVALISLVGGCSCELMLLASGYLDLLSLV